LNSAMVLSSAARAASPPFLCQPGVPSAWLCEEDDKGREAVGVMTDGSCQTALGLANPVASVRPAAVKSENYRPYFGTLKVTRDVDLVSKFDAVHKNVAIKETCFDGLSHGGDCAGRNRWQWRAR